MSGRPCVPDDGVQYIEASFDLRRWVRASWAAFRESGWNTFSFLVGLDLEEDQAMVIGVSRSPVILFAAAGPTQLPSPSPC